MKPLEFSQWSIAPLGEVTEILDRLRKPITKKDRKPGPYPYYGATGVLDQVDGYIFDEPLVLIGEDGAKWDAGENSAFPIEGKTWVNNHAHVIRPHRDRILDDWLIYYLNAADLMPFISGMTVPKLNQGRLREIPIPLPPLEEQRRIVAVLDEAFEGLARARENTEANLASAGELFESALQATFRNDAIKWNDTTLADLGSIVTGSTPKTSEKDNLGDHLPFVKPGDFLPDGSLVYDNQGLSEKGASASRVLPAGSALMVCIGATIGKAGYSDREIATNQQINAVVPREGISGEYLFYRMLTREFQAAVLHGSGQATLPIINKSKWSKLSVRLPNDLKIQSDIVDKLHNLRARLDEARALYGCRINDLEDLRQSLLQKAFAGELKRTSTAEIAAAGVAASDEATTASIIMLAYDAHKSAERDKTFGRKKAQKVIHLVDHYTDLMPGRQPIKDAAGPNDFPHMMKAEAWAEQHRAFRMKKRLSDGYDFLDMEDYYSELRAARKRLAPHAEILKRVVDVLIPMNSQEAEVFATVHAAWNNLIMDGGETDDETIVTEAREKWHADKSKIDRQLFFEAIKRIGACGLLPDGTGKYVGGQGSLL